MTNKTVTESTTDRELVITREFNAPAHLLYEACSTPEHLMKWFGPEGWPLTLCEVDFRVGGRYRFAMTGPDGTQNTPFGGQYLEIEPNRKISFDDAFEKPGAETMVITYIFDEHDGKTTMTIHTVFASARMKDEHMGYGLVEGLTSSLDQLEGVVAGLVRNEGA